jgi:hypothetical protein
MNRFYKPTPREYVSSQVDVPWEFLQGVAERKQLEFDKADAGLDAATKLLDFESIPGDREGKVEKQVYYNDKFLQIRDHLHTTGDVSGSARALTGVVRDIAQDKDIAIMKAAVEPYKEQFKSWQKMKEDDKFLSPWQEKFDPMYSTRDKETGRYNPYNQTVGYEAPDHYKNLNETFGTLHIDDITKGGYFIDENGMKITAVTGGGKIDADRIMQRAQQSLVNYRSTTSWKDHREQAKAEGFKGEEQIKRADEIGLSKLYHHGLQQIRTVYKSTQDASYMGDDYMKRFGMQDDAYIPLEAKDLFDTKADNDFDVQSSGEMRYSDTPFGKMATPALQDSKQFYKSFDRLKQENKQMALKYFESVNNPALKQRYLQGKLSQDELKLVNTNIKNYRNQFFSAAKQNLMGRTMADVGETAKQYVGWDAGSDGSFNASVLKSGAGFLTGQTKIYNESNGESLQLKDIEIEDGDKAVINKEYSPTSPYYTISGGDAKFASPRQLVITDKNGNVKGRYAIPVTNPNTKQGKVNTAVAKNATALYTPNTLVQSHRGNYKIKYVPYNPNTGAPMSNAEIEAARRAGMAMPASYNIYDNQGRQINRSVITSPEEATLEIEKLD